MEPYSTQENNTIDDSLLNSFREVNEEFKDKSTRQLDILKKHLKLLRMFRDKINDQEKKDIVSNLIKSMKERFPLNDEGLEEYESAINAFKNLVKDFKNENLPALQEILTSLDNELKHCQQTTSSLIETLSSTKDEQEKQAIVAAVASRSSKMRTNLNNNSNKIEYYAEGEESLVCDFEDFSGKKTFSFPEVNHKNREKYKRVMIEVPIPESDPPTNEIIIFNSKGCAVSRICSNKSYFINEAGNIQKTGDNKLLNSALNDEFLTSFHEDLKMQKSQPTVINTMHHNNNRKPQEIQPNTKPTQTKPIDEETSEKEKELEKHMKALKRLDPSKLTPELRMKIKEIEENKKRINLGNLSPPDTPHNTKKEEGLSR